MTGTYTFSLPVESSGAIPGSLEPETALSVMDTLDAKGITTVAVEVLPGLYNVKVVDDERMAA